jgi:transcription initiation factor IIE alpha subunit
VVPLSIRFPDHLETAIRRQAEKDVLTVSEWIRKVSYEEIVRREGRCPCCGQARLADESGVWREDG